MSNDFLELVGIIIGDGNLRKDRTHNFVEITGDIKKDKSYFNYILNLVNQFTFDTITLKERSKGLRIRISSRYFLNSLLEFGMHPNKNKLHHLRFLENIKLNDRIPIIRGLMDTDGCVIQRSNRQNFMEIATCSRFLANWINTSLKELGFRSFIMKYTNRKNQTIYRVWLSGRKNISKWIELIGFSNEFKYNKAKEILRLGQSGTGQ